MFRRRHRQSVMNFLEEVRVMQARKLLATTDLPIQTVAAEVGFRDPHYFGRVFRRNTGSPPGLPGRETERAFHPDRPQA
jgi:transcriptional regulator GlxA family with amidase domain